MTQGHRSSFASIALIACLAAFVASACSSNESDEALGRASEALSGDGGLIPKEVKANADTYLRAWLPNRNEGSQPVLRVRALGDNRALIRFDDEATRQLEGPVQLRVTIASNANDWGPQGRAVAVHRLTHDWTEAGATWFCSVDAHPNNFWPNCSGATAWDMGPFNKASRPWIETPTALATISNYQTGSLAFDVSSDIALFKSGAATNYGFLLKKVEEDLPGWVDLSSREGAEPPVLVGTCVDRDGDGACDDDDAGVDAGRADSGGGGSSDSGVADSSTEASTDAATCTTASCDDGLPCTLDACTATGCTHVPAPATQPCSDSIACNGLELCSGDGVCLPGTAPDLSDGNPCTQDLCDDLLGVSHPPVVDGTSCDNTTLCDGRETCLAGQCVAGTPPTLSDSNLCTDDSCDAILGVVHTPRPVGDPVCANADPCDGIELCGSGGVCQPGVPPALDDGNVCTLDQCTPTSGVTHTPIAGCDPTPVQSDAPLETRAALLGRLVDASGAGIAGATFTVYDERVAGAPRGDVAAVFANDGNFRIRLNSFPESEPARSPAHRLVVVIDAPGTLRAYRTAYSHPGEVVNLGVVRLVGRDPKITNIGPAGGTATDSQGRIEIVIPPGALATTVPVQITPFNAREDFTSPLPPATVTMYGFEAEPSGTTFSSPVTVRIANTKGLPTSAPIPVGGYDLVENEWVHEGLAAWDGTHFSGPITHFSPHDANWSISGDLMLTINKGANPNKGASVCQVGSSWMPGGGSVGQVFSLPGTTARGDALSLSLHYDSGLSGNRRLTGAGDTAAAPTSVGALPIGGLAVSIPGISMHTFCTARGGGGGGQATQPGQCTVAAGKCGTGGSVMLASISTMGSQLSSTRSTGPDSTDASFGGWVPVPFTTDGVLASTGMTTQTISLNIGGAAVGSAIKSCIGGGSSSSTFGVSDPYASRVQVDADPGPLQFTRKFLFHHRFTSPFGAGWALREISRLYTSGDYGVLVGGDGQEEEFRPRARLSSLPDRLGEQAFARDAATGETFVVSMPGTISRLDPTTFNRTAVVSGLALPSENLHSLAVAYVGGARHFIVASESQVLDVQSGGASRVLATRSVSQISNSFTQSNVAAFGSTVFYTAGDVDTPVLYRFDLTQANPAKQTVSAGAGGTVKLNPRAPISNVQFGQPLGLAFGADGVLYVADSRRNVVYRVSPSAPGAAIAGDSLVDLVVGTGDSRQLLPPGEAQPGRVQVINQPVGLSMSEDGKLLVLTAYGVSSYDTVAQEAELLFYHGDFAALAEVIPNLAGVSSVRPALPTSFVALSGTTFVSRTYNYGAARVDVDRLSSEADPTRTISTNPDGSRDLLDTSQGMIWHFEASGRLVEQKKRTGETDFTVGYVDARTDAVDHVTNAVGGVWKLTYASGKIDSITDPSGGRTQITVDGQGDLLGFVEPDGERHAFAYDAHHMVTKTTARGDVTAYTYTPEGTLKTSTKPGGEAYSFDTVPTYSTTYAANGNSSPRSGGYTDARGVRHDLTMNGFGEIDSETYTADGITRNVTAVHPEFLGLNEDPMSIRENIFQRTSQRSMNGVLLAAPLTFDSLGRPIRQQRTTSGLMHAWTYGADGWLVESLDAPSGASQHYERDPAGHVTRIYDGDVGTGGTPTGRETTFTWRPDGQPDTMTTHGVTTTFAYDDGGGSRNLTSTLDTLGRRLNLGYDARGNVTSVSDGTASSTSVFDANNRLLETRDALGNATTLGYTHAGCGCTEANLVTSVHTPDLTPGTQWSMTYGPQGRLASVIDPAGFAESYSYEPTGEVKTVKDRRARTTTMSHDQLGRLLSLVDTAGRRHDRSTIPSGGAWTGPSLTAASTDGTATTTALGDALRSGDYQVGVNAQDVEGFPAQISFYRDATFALGYSNIFDAGGRLTNRADRASTPTDFSSAPSGPLSGAYLQEHVDYEPRTSSPVVRSIEGPGSEFEHNAEFDLTASGGAGGGNFPPVHYVYTRDAGGRVTKITNLFESSFGVAFGPFSSYVYRPDGRFAQVKNADGVHDLTYDARGLLATQTIADEGTYSYGYDEVGRNTSITFPDGHVRRQTYDSLGRITSRCYEYAAASLTRCYGADYDPVGNPTRLSSPEGDDVMTYDPLDRVTQVTRGSPGANAVEAYDFNRLGALKLNAGVALDHQRPRLDGAGAGDAPVPATLDAQPVVLDPGGRITSLRGVTFTWTTRGYLLSAAPPIPAEPEQYNVDAFLRRIWKIKGSTIEHYLYEGADRVAIIGGPATDPNTGFGIESPVIESYLYAGVDHPLRMKRGIGTTVYYELDLAGNVRRLRGPGGTDLGGYRYTAFGKAVTSDAVVEQPLRWKARWYYDIAGGIYDVRARQWSPDLGSFLSIDELDFQTPTTSLWGWPNQNPQRLADPAGRGGLADIVVGAEVGAFVGAGIYVATAPTLSWEGLGKASLEGAVIGGAFGLNWSAGVLALGALQVESGKDLPKFGLAGGPGSSCPASGDVGAGATSANPGFHGSGPPGMVELNANVKSANYVKNFQGTSPVDFIYDQGAGVFRMGNAEGGHVQLAGGSESADVVGGTIWRENGGLRTNEHSGHYGQNWTPQQRDAFVDFMASFGIQVGHSDTW